MVSKFLNLIALSALALLAGSYGNTPVNALSLDSGHLHARHNHGLLAKRAPNRRCKARPTSSVAPSSTPAKANSPPAPTTTTPAPQPSPNPPTTVSNSGAKAGLAWAAGDNPTILHNFKTSHVGAVYNWGPYKVNGADQAGYEFVPMLWGTKDVDAWKKLVVPGYARYALGFNEPDHGEQAYMNPWDAASLWNQLMRPLRNSGYTLISPATTSAPNSKDWMRNFLNACGGSCVDKIAVHWYGTDSQQFITYLTEWHDAFGLPIWVTEFACMDFVSFRPCPDVMKFASDVRAFMDRTPWVEHYFPFGMQYNMGNVNAVNALLKGDNTPTDLAWRYFAA